MKARRRQLIESMTGRFRELAIELEEQRTLTVTPAVKSRRSQPAADAGGKK